MSKELEMSKELDESVPTLLVLANGKTLEEHPFHLYQVPTIGMNHAYRYWKMIGWWPTYYCSVDKESNTYFYKHIKDLVENRKKYGIKKFLLSRLILNKCPEFLKLNDGVNRGLEDGGKTIYFIEDLIRKQKVGFKGEFQQTSGSISARFGIYLGFKKICVLGVDCSYGSFDMKWARSMIDDQGRLIKTVRPEPLYFFEGYRSRGDFLHIPPERRMQDRPNHHMVFEVLDQWFNMKTIEKSDGKNDEKDGRFRVVRKKKPMIVNLNPKSRLYELKVLPFESFPLEWIPEDLSAEELNAQKPKVLAAEYWAKKLGKKSGENKKNKYILGE